MSLTLQHYSSTTQSKLLATCIQSVLSMIIYGATILFTGTMLCFCSVAWDSNTTVCSVAFKPHVLQYHQSCLHLYTPIIMYFYPTTWISDHSLDCILQLCMRFMHLAVPLGYSNIADEACNWPKHVLCSGRFYILVTSRLNFIQGDLVRS